jgi:hypothetical protein
MIKSILFEFIDISVISIGRLQGSFKKEKRGGRKTKNKTEKRT